MAVVGEFRQFRAEHTEFPLPAPSCHPQGVGGLVLLVIACDGAIIVQSLFQYNS